MRVVLGFSFPADYVVEQVAEFRSVENVLRPMEKGVWRSGDPTIGLWGQPGGNAMNLRIIPDKAAEWDAWIPCGSGKLSGIYATPSRDYVCVIAGGDGYWINVRDPDQSESIRARTMSITNAVEVPDHNIVVFSNSIELFAYGPSGLLWRTEQTFWDGIWIHRVDGNKLFGDAWDVPSHDRVPFTLDLLTGQVRGGSNPEKPQILH